MVFAGHNTQLTKVLRPGPLCNGIASRLHNGRQRMPCVYHGHSKRSRHESQGRMEHAVDAAAQDAVIRPAHAGVGDKRRAAWENLLVGGLDVRMRAQNGGYAPLEMMAEQVLVRGCLG